MAQITRQIALHASWLRVITLDIKGYLLKTGALGTETAKSTEGKTSFPVCSLSFVLQSAPSSGAGENSFWKAHLEIPLCCDERMVGCRLWGRTESDTTEATWQQQQQQCLVGAWIALVSRSPFSDEKLKTRAVVLNWGDSAPRKHSAGSVDVFGCLLFGVSGMLLSWICRSQGCC